MMKKLNVILQLQQMTKLEETMTIALILPMSQMKKSLLVLTELLISITIRRGIFLRTMKLLKLELAWPTINCEEECQVSNQLKAMTSKQLKTMIVTIVQFIHLECMYKINVCVCYQTVKYMLICSFRSFTSNFRFPVTRFKQTQTVLSADNRCVYSQNC